MSWASSLSSTTTILYILSKVGFANVTEGQDHLFNYFKMFPMFSVSFHKVVYYWTEICQILSMEATSVILITEWTLGHWTGSTDFIDVTLVSKDT